MFYNTGTSWTFIDSKINTFEMQKFFFLFSVFSLSISKSMGLSGKKQHGTANFVASLIKLKILRERHSENFRQAMFENFLIPNFVAVSQSVCV